MIAKFITCLDKNIWNYATLFELFVFNKKKTYAQSAGAVEYTDCFSAEG